MAYYARPEEILYHTHLSQNMLMGAKIALLPGDPGRVQSLAEAMGPAVELVSHREYTSYLAQVASQPILVISTGMGGPSTAICLEELARLGIKRVIRVGTTGSIKEIWAMLSLSRELSVLKAQAPIMPLLSFPLSLILI